MINTRYLSALLLFLPAVAGASADVMAVMTCRPAAANAVELKLVMFGLRAAPSRERAAKVEFVTPNGKHYDSPAPGPRSVTVPIPRRAWPADHVEVVPVGRFTVAGNAPARLQVHGGLVGGPRARLGTLVRAGDSRVTFERHCPWPAGDGDHRVIVAASCKRVGARRFYLKVAYFNCGEAFSSDHSAFVHYEFAAKGEDLDPPIALGLLPTSIRMDTASWSRDTVTVVQLRPIDIPRDAPEFVYVRAGIYDQFGTKKRINCVGSDDGTGRVLVGRFVNRPDRVEFERTFSSHAAKTE